MWEAVECGMFGSLGNISHVGAAERGAVGTETRKRMNAFAGGRLPGLFFSSPITTPPTRHLGKKGVISQGKA